MTQYTSQLLTDLSTRGYIHQITDGPALDALAAREIIPGYIGFDATAPSLHVGSLVQIMMLRRLQQAGHKPIVVMGGGTTKVGDPSGKDESRKMLDDAGIAANIAGIRTVFERFLTFGDGPTDAIMIDNAEWLDKLEYVPFLRDVGKHFTINRMLTFDSVKLRLEREQPLTFLEFNYMILQAYDFLELSRRAACRLQMGGSDQWGNIVNGIELTRRMDGTHLFGLTTPLITLADGGKMGKTAAGAVWLNADALPAYDYYQFWRNTQDADVGRFLKLFTDLPVVECDRLGALEGAEINEAKKVLAFECTRMAHGDEAANAARDTAAATFSGGAGADLPVLKITNDGIKLTEALIKIGFVNSNKEARRKIEEGAVRIAGDQIRNPTHIIALDSDSPPAKISMGIKRQGLIVFEERTTLGAAHRANIGTLGAAVFGVDTSETIVVIDYKNFGNATGNIISLRAAAAIFPSPPAHSQINYWNLGQNIIESGHAQNVKLILDRPIFSNDILKFSKNGISLYAHLEIEYNTADGDSYIRSVAYYLDPNTKLIDGRYMLSICEVGNGERRLKN